MGIRLIPGNSIASAISRRKISRHTLLAVLSPIAEPETVPIPIPKTDHLKKLVSERTPRVNPNRPST